MDFWATVLVLCRRWYVAVPAFVATLGISAVAYSIVPQQYQSASILVLTTPLSGGTEATNPNVPNSLTNPMMNFDRSLALSASIVIQLMNTSEIADSLGVTPGGATSYEVSNGSTNPELLESGPFIFVTATAPSPEEAQALAHQVSDTAAAVLVRRQDELNAPASTHINVQAVVPPTAGKLLSGSPMRAAAAAGALAALASLATVFGFESLMTHRRRRRANETRTAGQDGDGRPSAPRVGEGGRAGEAVVRAVHSTPLADRHRINGSARASSGHALGVLASPAEGDGGPEPEGR